MTTGADWFSWGLAVVVATVFVTSTVFIGLVTRSWRAALAWVMAVLVVALVVAFLMRHGQVSRTQTSPAAPVASPHNSGNL